MHEPLRQIVPSAHCASTVQDVQRPPTQASPIGQSFVVSQGPADEDAKARLREYEKPEEKPAALEPAPLLLSPPPPASLLPFPPALLAPPAALLVPPDAFPPALLG